MKWKIMQREIQSQSEKKSQSEGKSHNEKINQIENAFKTIVKEIQNNDATTNDGLKLYTQFTGNSHYKRVEIPF